MIAASLWPGPFTLIVPRKEILPKIVTGDLDSVGVRVPKHDKAIQLIHSSNGLLIGTSANKTGRKPPTDAYQAAKQLGESVDVILDGGSTPLGVSSTVIDLTSKEPKIIRKGSGNLELIKTFLSNHSSLDS
jgi:L-threonylcarbamoyladenylate synthase